MLVSRGTDPQVAAQPTAAGGRLVAEAVDYVYAGRGDPVHALDGVTLEIAGGEFVCCVGPSGCGKTTLLHLLAGFLAPTEGRVTLDGRPIQGPGADRAVVFQQPTLYPWMSVAANVGLGPKMRGVPKSERERIVRHYLRVVHLEGVAQRPPYELSGGMQQRVAIARVLANDPRFLLMDEPFGSLDALTREHLQVELLSIWRATRKGVLFITHSAEEAVFLGTRVIVMSSQPGRIVLDRPLPFSQQAGLDARGVRASREFIAAREEIIERIYSSHAIQAATQVWEQ